jgi:hypothetical protein
MKNKIIQNIRKQIMKNTEIRELVANNKELDEMINTMDIFKDLCNPTKIRMRNFMVLQEADDGLEIPMNDPLACDMFYICSGHM